MGTLTTAWFGVGTASSQDRDGKNLWANPTNILVDDLNYATNEPGLNDYGDWLRAMNFGITGIGDNFSVTGIEFRVTRRGYSAYFTDSSIRIRITSGQVGDDMSTVDVWDDSTPPEVYTYGSTTEEFNSNLIGSDVKSANFGVDVSAFCSGTAVCRVYYVECRITYEVPNFTVFKSPGTVANVDRDGQAAWSNVDNAKIDDANFAESDPAAESYSDWLTCTNFGFTVGDVPAGATIDGILVRITKACEREIVDSAIYLLDGDGAQQGDNKADAVTEWPNGPGSEPTVYDHGGTDDDWNAGLTAADVIDSDFGVRISAYNPDNRANKEAYVYYVELAIKFTPGGETPGPYKLKYRKGGATTEITTYEAAGGGWNESLAIRANNTTYYAQCDSNTSHTNASDLRVRIGGTTYAVLTEEGTPT